jgi:hypothetical protein
MRFRLGFLLCVFAVWVMGTTLVHAEERQRHHSGNLQQVQLIEKQLRPRAGQPQVDVKVIDRITPELTMSLLEQAGYTDLELIELSGQQQVKGKINEQPVVVLHKCDKDGVCQILSFVAPLGKQQAVDLSWVNSWNLDKMLARLALDDQGNTYFQMDIHLFGGVSPNYVATSGAIFGELIKALYQYQPETNNSGQTAVPQATQP